MIIKRSLFRSKLFQTFLRNDWWDAHHVDLHWRIGGKDVIEEADWLKDVWYALRGKRNSKTPFEYERPDDFVTFYEDSEFGALMMILRFDGLPNVEFNVRQFPEESRQWLAEVLHRQIATLAHEARASGIQDFRNGFKHLMEDMT